MIAFFGLCVFLVCLGCGAVGSSNSASDSNTSTSSASGKADTQAAMGNAMESPSIDEAAGEADDVCVDDDCNPSDEAVPVTEDDDESTEENQTDDAEDGMADEQVTGDEANEPSETTEVDAYSQARDVTIHRVTFEEDFEVPAYQYPASAFGMRLGGTEFWQKWPEGENPTYSFSDGTTYGRRCMVASAIRFSEIMKNAPENLKRLREESSWSGSFFNWNDDFSKSPWGDGRGARLWAWRTSLIKWISQTNQDGSCYLPTLAMVEAVADTCLTYSERGDGEIQGCSAR